ncbi:hypothetical protein [Paucibacter soli]|uniref:hypothetical protein n=1 Tax=Paucibacter soli TaxID=3133433 RepID=UPI00309F345F
MRARAAMGAGLALALAGLAHAELIEIGWGDTGRFERQLSLAPGKFAEICGPLQAGQTVNWNYQSDQALNFNIHYHLGKEVRYPARVEQSSQEQGSLVVDGAQDYCWMWSNKSRQTVKLSVTLSLPK